MLYTCNILAQSFPSSFGFRFSRSIQNCLMIFSCKKYNWLNLPLYLWLNLYVEHPCIMFCLVCYNKKIIGVVSAHVLRVPLFWSRVLNLIGFVLRCIRFYFFCITFLMLSSFQFHFVFCPRSLWMQFSIFTSNPILKRSVWAWMLIVFAFPCMLQLRALCNSLFVPLHSFS